MLTAVSCLLVGFGLGLDLVSGGLVVMHSLCYFSSSLSLFYPARSSMSIRQTSTLVGSENSKC